MSASAVTAPAASGARIRVNDLAVWADKAAFTAFFFAVAMPFPQLFNIPLGIFTFNFEEFIYLLCGALLCLKILLRGKLIRPAFSITVLLIVAVYFFLPILLDLAEMGDSLNQIRGFYMPFLLAILWFMAGSRITLHKYFRLLLPAAIFSAGSALAIQHLFPTYMQTLAVTTHGSGFRGAVAGRLYWMNQTCTYLVLFYFAVRDRFSRVGWILAIPALLLVVAAAFNTLSRTLLLGIAVFLAGAVVTSAGWHEAVRRAGQLFGIGSVLAAIAAIFLATDQKIRELVYLRFFGGGDGAARVYKVDFVMGRVTLYQQYWERIRDTFPFGLGFGRAFDSIFSGQVIVNYVTDVSFLAFLLPMGLTGVVIFMVLLRRFWTMAAENTLPTRYRRTMRLLLLLALAASLNVEFFCRDNFVVEFTLLAMAATNSGIARTNNPEAADAV